MKNVVLFKSASEDYVKAFSDHNYHAIFVEPLQFIFTNTQKLDNSLKQKDYSGLILTSPRAIEAIAKCWDPAKFALWNTKKVYTVGDASSLKIKLLLGLEAVGMTAGNSENLGKIIINDHPEKGKFLFPCGNLRSEVLPDLLKSNGITVDAMTVYETKENNNLKSDLMKLSLSELVPCCMVFFSPSGCEYIHRQLQTFNNSLSLLPHFAIGNSTALKIESIGVEIAGVAARPKAESIAESVQNYFFSLSSCS